MLLYIDPGTGSMLFTVLIGVVAASMFFVQKLIMRLKFFFSGGRATEMNEKKIPYLIFCEGRQYWNLFRPILDAFERREVEVAYWTSAKDDPVFDASYRYVNAQFIGEGNAAFAKLNLMNVGVCLATTPGLDVYQWKRSKNTDWYAHIFHGIDEGLAYRMFGLDFYDAVLLSGRVQEANIRRLEELRGIPQKELYLAGLPYMDALLDKARAAGVLSEGEGEAPAGEQKGETTVLLAPSWGESGILRRYGEKMIDALLSTGYRIVIRPHPQTVKSEKEFLEPLQKKYPDGERLTWNYDSDNFSALCGADLMISDYSSVMFDYSLVFNRPILYANAEFDPAPYDAAWIDGPIWRFQILPKLGKPLEEADFPRLKERIDELLHNPAGSRLREEVRDEGWAYIGESAERIVEYMLQKYKEIQEKKIEPLTEPLEKTA